jgi:predicted DCC family thiol-disulfide oxidoreductase YuxK
MDTIDELQNSKKTIFLFDGHCNLCNGAVDFILKNEKSAEIIFGSIQSESAQKLLKSFGVNIEKLETSYVIHKGKLFEKAEGSLQLALFLKKPWSYVKGFQILPTSFLNIFYDFISKNRYRFFGKKETCRLPTSSERDRFLS